jgi:hypothetical protein
MSDERGCLGRAFRIGCGCTLILMLVAAGLTIYVWMARSPVAPELSVEERETATSKLEALERSLRTRQPIETQFNEAELTLLVQQYLDEQRIEGDVSVTLPGDDLELSFRTSLEQLERFMNLDQLPSWLGADVRGVFRVHLIVVDNEPFAELEGASLYGLPVPMRLLGAAAHGNWFDRLDADTASAIRRVRSLEIRDATLFIRVD